MAILIDTSIFIALRNSEDRYHDRASVLMENALKGMFGQVYTSDYIIDESITVALARTKRHDYAVNMGKFIIDSPRIVKLHIEEETFLSAWTKFQALNDKGLSFTDCTSLALTEKHRIKNILSFDCGFDGLIQRIC